VQFPPRHIGRQVAQAAIGIDHQPGRIHVLQGPPDPRGDKFRVLHRRRFDVDHAQPERSRPGVLPDQPQVLQALAGELQD
jgi:hypothetical protein